MAKKPLQLIGPGEMGDAPARLARALLHVDRLGSRPAVLSANTADREMPEDE